MALVKCFLVLLLMVSNLTYALPRITVIATGGAFSGTTVDNLTGKFELGTSNTELLALRNVEILKLAKFTFYDLMNLPSQKIDFAELIKIAKAVNEEINKKSVDGVIVTHGTDTMEVTAYFLNLVIKTKKPIVVTGGMLAQSHPSSDIFQNMLDSVRVASNKNAFNKGVLVVGNKTIISAREYQKISTNALGDFGSTSIGVLGYVHNEIVDIHHSSTKIHTTFSSFNIKEISSLPEVDIAYIHGGVKSVFSSKNTEGIVIAGVGSGNISQDGLESLKSMQKKGKFIVRASLIQGHPVFSNISSEVDDKNLNFIAANNLNPQKARVLLALCLTKTKDIDKIREIFMTY